MNVIGIAGRMFAGKSSLANELAKELPNTLKLGFAKAVRDELRAAVFGGSLPKDLPKSVQGNIIEWLQEPCLDRVTVLWDKPTPQYMRELLQWWGTDYRRAQDPDYWVKRFDKLFCTTMLNRTNIIIDDLRFPNEVEYVRSFDKCLDCKGLVLWLERDVEGQDREHSSENSIGANDCDVVIDSNCKLEDMLEAGVKAVKGWISGRTRSDD